MRSFLSENSLEIGYLLGFLITVALAVWAYRDAAARERRYGRAPLGVVPALWAVGMLLLTPLTLITYLVVRGHRAAR